MLRIRGLSKSFTNHLRAGANWVVLDRVDLDVAAGQCVVLTGASGSGKSSLLRCVYGTYAPSGGTIDLDTPGGTVDLASTSDRELLAIRRDVMGMVTQFLSVPPRVSALDLVIDQGVSAERASRLLSKIGLAAELHQLPPATFSGGERQLVNIAVALARPKPLLLLDEITASLDHGRRETVLALLREYKNSGSALLAIFHELPQESGLIDEVCRVESGSILELA